MFIARVRVIPYRHMKKLGGDEDIYTPRAPINKDDKNVQVPCAFCSATLLISSIRAATLDDWHYRFIFCSPYCKLKSMLKGKDPNKCWVFTRPGFVWDDRMFSFRALCYEMYFNETTPQSRDLIATCRQKRCSNPLHVKKRIRVISFDL